MTIKNKLYMPSVDADIHIYEQQCNLFLSQDVVSFLLDAQRPFPYISANEKADGC